VNLLVDPLPITVSIRGQAWPINSEFYVGILFELLMQDPSLPDTEKVAGALSLYYPKVPADIEGAIEAMLWFYRCGAQEKRGKGGGEGAGRPQKAYCFSQDAELIYSAFYSQYHIDLSEAEDLHWWKFRALFAGLSSECELKKIMGYRTADLKGMGKEQRKLYEKMRKLYALKNPRNVESSMSLAERDQRMKDYVARRFSEVQNEQE